MHPVLRVGLHYGVFFSPTRCVVSCLLLMYFISLDSRLGGAFVMRYFFLRRVASYFVLLAVVDVFISLDSGCRELLLCGIFFSDALRRILFFLLLLMYLFH